jgi:hypothetical protein
MLIKIISWFRAFIFKYEVCKLISWKDSFEKINNELDLARKKQTALEELHSNGKISQLTYENLNKALTTEIEQIEARRKELAEKMTSKLNELERQISTLETFLANVEMSYAAGEITEELHNQEVSALNLGLEATKNELDFIKEAIMQLVPKETQTELTATMETAEAVEATPTEAAMETVPEVSTTAPIEAPVETPPITDETDIEQPTEVIAETTETPETLEMPEPPIETPTEEITSEEQGTEETLETPTEETISEEPLATEEPIETPTEESQPFPEENPEE